jgi:hypothetical protein
MLDLKQLAQVADTELPRLRIFAPAAQLPLTGFQTLQCMGRKRACARRTDAGRRYGPYYHCKHAERVSSRPLHDPAQSHYRRQRLSEQQSLANAMPSKCGIFIA